MSNFGFDKRKGDESNSEELKPMEKSGLPRGPVVNDPARERQAMQRAEDLGYTDRGQGRGIVRRRPVATPTATVYIKGPEEVLEWFINYTAERGHKAYWNSIDDFRKLIEQEAGSGA